MNINYNDFGNQPIQLEVFDINGRNLYNKLFIENDSINCEVNLSNLTKGYFLLSCHHLLKLLILSLLKTKSNSISIYKADSIGSFFYLREQ